MCLRMAAREDEATRLRSQLQRRTDEVRHLQAELRDKDAMINELNSTIELLRVGLGHLHKPRLRAIGISAEPAVTTNNIDTSIVYHAKSNRLHTSRILSVILCKPLSVNVLYGHVIC